MLSRKKGEEVFVQTPDVVDANGDLIVGSRLVRVIVVEVRGDKVRLGFEADRDVTVHRREVAERLADGEEGRPCRAPTGGR